MKSSTIAMKRIRSLDALRGFDMFWIVCGEGIFHGMAAAIKEKHSLTQRANDWQIETKEGLNFFENILIGISNQLHHSVWNGFTFYDLIFPLFIFIAGISMPVSFSRQLEKETNRSAARRKIIQTLLRRTILLILLGMVVNGALQFKGYEETRFASVLGRIAVSCCFAAIILLYCSVRGQIIWFAGLLLAYWAMLSFIPVPGYGAGVLTPEGNFAAYIDRLFLPGKLHKTDYDPEGLLSGIPSIATALLGIFTGQFLQVAKFTAAQKTALLALAGIVLLATGHIWGFVFPVNKTMWTSSFVLYSGGWSLLLFSFFYFVIDIAGFTKWANPFVWIGMNSILIYVTAHGLINYEHTSAFLFGGMIDTFPGQWHTAVMWTGVAIIQFAGLFFLYKKKWFLKL